MKRFHIHIKVKDLKESENYYNTIFESEPTVKEDDYIKWQLDEPAVNFAISKTNNKVGLDHLGIQVSSDKELEIIASNLKKTKIKAKKEQAINCCYATSDKYWSIDPSGIAWESFRTLSKYKTFSDKEKTFSSTACCSS